MSRTLTSAVVLSAFAAIGCVVPVNLEKESAVPNTRPSIVGGEPSFVSATALAHDQTLTLKVVARDPDTSDILQARLWRSDNDGVWLGDPKFLTTTGDNGVERSLTISDRSWCKEWNADPNQLFFLSIYVSDLDFPNNGDKPSIEHSDVKTWPILCQ